MEALHERVAAALKRGDAVLADCVRRLVDDDSQYPTWFASINNTTGSDIEAIHRCDRAKWLFALFAYSPTFVDFVEAKLTRTSPPIYPDAQRYLVRCLVLHDVLRGKTASIPSHLIDIAQGNRPTPSKIEAALCMGRPGGELGSFPGVSLSDVDPMRYDNVTSVDLAAHYLDNALRPEGAAAAWARDEKQCRAGFSDSAEMALTFMTLSVRTYDSQKSLAAALKQEIDGGLAINESRIARVRAY